MGIMTDEEIIYAIQDEDMAIVPFLDYKVKKVKDRLLIASYGLQPHGYDVRIGWEYKVIFPAQVGTYTHDIKYIDLSQLTDIEEMYLSYNARDTGNNVIIPATSCALLETYEYLEIPTYAIGIPTLKSTWSRVGLQLSPVCFEAGWNGYATLQVYNPLPVGISMPVMNGLAQVHFFTSDRAPSGTYDGKYQNAEGIQTPKIG